MVKKNGDTLVYEERQMGKRGCREGAFAKNSYLCIG